MNCNKQALTLQTQCFFSTFWKNVNSGDRRFLPNGSNTVYLQNTTQAVFTSSSLCQQDWCFSLCPTEDFHVKSTLLMLTVVKKKKKKKKWILTQRNLLRMFLWNPPKTGQSSSVSLFTLERFAKAKLDPYIHNHSGVVWVFPELEFHLSICHPKAAFGPGDPLSSFPLCQKAILCFFSASDGASC